MVVRSPLTHLPLLLQRQLQDCSFRLGTRPAVDHSGRAQLDKRVSIAKEHTAS
jgi:hypothetical protein